MQQTPDPHNCAPEHCSYPMCNSAQVDMLFEFISLLIKDDETFPETVRSDSLSHPRAPVLSRVFACCRIWTRKTLRRSKTWSPVWCTTSRARAARGSTACSLRRAATSARAARSVCATRCLRSFFRDCSSFVSYTRRLPREKARLTVVARHFSECFAITDYASHTGISVALKKLFQFLHQTTQALAEIPRSDAALRLFLQCAQAASDCNLEPVAYEFMERAYEIFEESIPGAKARAKEVFQLTWQHRSTATCSVVWADGIIFAFFCLLPTDSKAQVTALQLIIGSLQRCTVFGADNRAALVHKATGYSAKLLKKPDQCRAVYTCAHLFWHDTNETLCDAESVLACLKRALKIANAAQVRVQSALQTGCVSLTFFAVVAQQMATASRGDAGPVVLFIEILNKCAERGAGRVPATPFGTGSHTFHAWVVISVKVPVLLRQGLRSSDTGSAAGAAAAHRQRAGGGCGPERGAGCVPQGHCAAHPRAATEGWGPCRTLRSGDCVSQSVLCSQTAGKHKRRETS